MLAQKTRAVAQDTFQRKHPSGAEVSEWLANNKLAHYTSTLDGLGLNSLRKISEMTPEDVQNVHQTFLEQNSDMIQGLSLDIANLGDRINLGSAVEALNNDKRTMTLKDQVLFYKDPKVAGLNILMAQNQLELIFAKKRLHFLLIGIFFVGSVYNMYWALMYRERQNYAPKTFSVTTYGVQLSHDATNWTDLPCADRTGGTCVFESSILASQPDAIVRHLFIQPEPVRYLKILPWTWSRMEEEDLSGAGKLHADMRVGIIGGSDTGSVPFRVLNDGVKPF